MTIFNVFTLMGGIAMFLYGMDLMGKALEQTAGSKLQGILSTMTSSPIRGLLLGMAVTAVIQSSGATTVMAVGFVNSGLMELHQAISVIMGANVGTTVTGWLLSLSGLEGDSFLTKMMNPTAWSPILGFIGIWLYMIGKDRKRGVGKILLGFSILMAGMNTMSHAMSPLADEPWFMDLFLSFKNPILGVIAGAVLTASLTACTPLDAAEIVYDSIFGGGSSSTGSAAEDAENSAVAEGVADRFMKSSPNAVVSYGVPELTSTIQPKFTPDWFQKNEERGIYLDPALSIGSGQTLGGFLENSLKDYVRQSNFVAFLAFDSTGMSAGEQAERFNNIDLVPSVTVHAVTVSPSSNTKLRVGVCHKTVEGREYCLVVVVRAR